jgi:hypothetical protein
MKPSTRLVLATLLFGGWIGWLAYLVGTTTQPIVLSRPQLLVSTVDVIARVEADGDRPSRDVQILEVRWPKDQPSLARQSIVVTNLPQSVGWRGPGDYILPLIKTDDSYEIARIPPSPGFAPSTMEGSASLRIYPRTPETERQLDGIPKSGK